MKKMNVFALVLVIAMMMSALGGCSAEVEALEPTPVPEATEEPAAEATPEPTPEGPVPLTEWDIRPFVWFNDLYIMEGTEVNDYLQYVSLIDEEAVTQVDVAAEGIDTSVVGDYDLTYTAAVDRDLYDAYIAAQDSLVAYEVPADETSEVWRIDNVEYAGLEVGTEYTILAKYLVTEAADAEDSDSDAEAEDVTVGNVPPALLRDADGAIIYSEVSFVPESESGELQIEHIVDAALIPEGMTATPEYFLLAAGEEAELLMPLAAEDGEDTEAVEPMDAAEEVAEIVEDAEDAESAEDAEVAEDASNEAANAELVEVVRVVHVVSAEDFDAITTSGGVVSVGDGVATEAAVVEETVAGEGDEAEAENQEITSGQTINTDDPAANGNSANNTDTMVSGNSENTNDKANAGNTSTSNAGSTAGGTSTIATPKPTATPKPSPSSGSTSGGGTSTKPAHTHSYTSAVTTVATCTSAGTRTYTCSCGASYTESIPATGHNWTTETVSDGHYETVVDQEAWTEYTNAGYECLKCHQWFANEIDCAEHCTDVCGWSYTKLNPIVTQHDAVTHDVWVDTSYTVQKCSVCGTIQ